MFQGGRSFWTNPDQSKEVYCCARPDQTNPDQSKGVCYCVRPDQSRPIQRGVLLCQTNPDQSKGVYCCARPGQTNSDQSKGVYCCARPDQTNPDQSKGVCYCVRPDQSRPIQRGVSLCQNRLADRPEQNRKTKTTFLSESIPKLSLRSSRLVKFKCMPMYNDLAKTRCQNRYIYKQQTSKQKSFLFEVRAGDASH